MRKLLLALALALAAACGGGTEQTPLPGAALDCRAAAAAAELVACDEDRGVALIHSDNPYLPEDVPKVDQYFLIPLRVASVDDFRSKRDWAWQHWDVWQKEDIDICDVKLGPIPDSLMLELSPTDFKPAECR